MIHEHFLEGEIKYVGVSESSYLFNRYRFQFKVHYKVLGKQTLRVHTFEGDDKEKLEEYKNTFTVGKTFCKTITCKVK